MISGQSRVAASSTARFVDDSGLARPARVKLLNSRADTTYRASVLMMTWLKVADILANSPIDPQRHLDPERVARYRHSIDELPPVVVFETEGGLPLADGYHRLAAALAEGREIVECEVRQGSRREALEYAVTVGADQAGLSPEEVRRHLLGRYSPRDR